MSPDRPSLTRREMLQLCLMAGASIAAHAAEGTQKTVWGIAELFEWVFQRRQSTGSDTADCLQAHLDHGVKNIIWDLGRSVLCYHSALPTSTLYTGDSRPETKLIGDSLRKECSLRAALGFAAGHGMTIYGRLSMNRHYGSGYGGGLRSKFVADHPEWLERDRRGKVDETRVSFAVPEYRTERIAILLEAAQLGAHGLCLDFCRQPPIVRYHPLVLDPWLQQGKSDPRDMTAGSQEFLEWSRHRCEFVNQFLRDLRAQMRDFEKSTGRKVPILARITEGTLDLNLMEGMDVRTWVKENLVDEIALDPFRLWDFKYPDSAVPYIALCRERGVKVHGGVNGTAARGTRPNRRAFLERVDRNYQEGTDGIAIYQSDTPLHDARLKPILASLFLRLGDSAAVRDLARAARNEQPELDGKSRHFGVDNHSKFPQFGHAPMQLAAI